MIRVVSLFCGIGGSDVGLYAASRDLGVEVEVVAAYDSWPGSFVSNSWHGNEESKLEGCRNPSLLEMARDHSLPDSWKWCNATKGDRGKMIANMWCVGMATAVMRATLVAMGTK